MTYVLKFTQILKRGFLGVGIGAFLLSCSSSTLSKILSSSGSSSSGVVSSITNSVTKELQDILKGQVYLQTISASAGDKSVIINVQSIIDSVKSQLTTLKENPIEISLLDENGLEVLYKRLADGDFKVDLSSVPVGDYVVWLKSNSEVQKYISFTNSGSVSLGTPEAFEKAETSIYKDYTLKAFVNFARQCKKLNSAGNTDTVTAASGSYFVQPFVFLGKVESSKKVTPISSATIKITLGDQSVTLKKLSELDYATFKEHASLTKAQHEEYTRQFYQGYLSGAGEMYTLDTFLFGGDCANAVQFNLGSDPGTAEVKLTVQDASIDPALNETIGIRPSASTSFSMYETTDVKISDWTQCTFNKLTGLPETYNGSASECKSFTFSAPPYVTLDYKLPSGLSGTTTTVASDPTRILYYGHAVPKEYYTQIIAKSADLISGASTGITLAGCSTIGGLNSVPISTDKTYMPLKEFNAGLGDLLNLARRNGSYTSLAKFYQGNVDMSGTFDLPVCLISGSDSCASFKIIKVTSQACSYKADSGVAVGSTSDSFIYPSYFEMSGTLKE